MIEAITVVRSEVEFPTKQSGNDTFAQAIIRGYYEGEASRPFMVPNFSGGMWTISAPNQTLAVNGKDRRSHLTLASLEGDQSQLLRFITVEGPVLSRYHRVVKELVGEAANEAAAWAKYPAFDEKFMGLMALEKREQLHLSERIMADDDTFKLLEDQGLSFQFDETSILGGSSVAFF